MSHLRRCRVVLAVVGALALVAAACSDEGTTTPTSLAEETTTTTEAAPPTNAVIDLWYGSEMSVGKPGIAQPLVNIPGNASDPDGVRALDVRLNGGSWRPLGIGPDTTRLVRAGDFNAELGFDELSVGDNDVEIRLTDELGEETIAPVSIAKVAAQRWPLPYRADWSEVEALTELAQPVDGRWVRSGDGVRSDATGYDRLLAVGDRSWTNYVVEVPVTVNSVDPTGYPCPSCGPGVGILARWNGHTADVNQPRRNVIPLGGLGWYHWNRDRTENLQLRDHRNIMRSADKSGFQLQLGVTHVFKLEVLTVPNGQHRFRLKVWPEGGVEPDWALTIFEPAAAPSSGSVLLVAHWVDAVWGDVTVTPL